MRDNQNQHRQSTSLTQTIMTTIFGGLIGSDSERQPPNDNFQQNHRMPDQAAVTRMSNERETSMDIDHPTDFVSRGPAHVEGGQTHKEYIGNRSQPSEHVSSIHDLQRSTESRTLRPPRESERPERASQTPLQRPSLQDKDDLIFALQTKMEDLEMHYSQLDDRYRSAKKERDEGRRKITHLGLDLDEAQRHGQEREREIRKLRELLNHRTEEVKVAQAFMTTADKYSLAEVCQMVERLNDEIYQCSMDLSDAMIRQDIVPQNVVLNDAAKQRLEGAQRYFSKWNEGVMSRLASEIRRDDHDTTLFDCVAQSVLVEWAHRTIRAFCPQDTEVDRYLSNLWEEVATSHETSIAKNWLSITRTALKSKGQSLDRAGIVKRLGYLMEVSGREALPEDRLVEAIGGKLEQMGKSALKIKEAISEGVLSVDIEVFSCRRNVEFHPTSMRNAFETMGRGRGGGGEESGDFVVCPTGLGLRGVTRERSRSDRPRVHSTMDVLLKTKVLLFSIVNE